MEPTSGVNEVFDAFLKQHEKMKSIPSMSSVCVIPDRYVMVKTDYPHNGHLWSAMIEHSYAPPLVNTRTSVYHKKGDIYEGTTDDGQFYIEFRLRCDEECMGFDPDKPPPDVKFITDYAIKWLGYPEHMTVTTKTTTFTDLKVDVVTSDVRFTVIFERGSPLRGPEARKEYRDMTGEDPITPISDY
jgi:hypothetical protein